MGVFISVESAKGVQTFSKHLRLVVCRNAVRVAVTTRPPQNVRRADRAELTRCQRVLLGLINRIGLIWSLNVRYSPNSGRKPDIAGSERLPKADMLLD
jgi:hypothetical protein